MLSRWALEIVFLFVLPSYSYPLPARLPAPWPAAGDCLTVISWDALPPERNPETLWKPIYKHKSMIHAQLRENESKTFCAF